jgi:hypothetical protein
MKNSPTWLFVILLKMLFVNIAICQPSTLNPNTLLNSPEDSAKSNLSSNAILSPYSFSAGSNFDFIDGIELKDLYFNVGTFSPNLIEIKNFNIGVEMGVRKSYARVYESNVENKIYYSISSNYISNDSIEINKSDIEKTTELGLTNTHFYLHPIVEIFEKFKYKKNVKIFLSFDFEMMKHRLDWRYSYDTLSIETMHKPTSDAVNYPNIALTKRDMNDNYIYTAGVGLPFMIEDSRALFFGRTGIGYANLVRPGYHNFKRIYFDMSFEIVEKEFGFSLRTQLRYFGRNNPPFISFNIAKYFRLSKIVKFLPGD